MKRFDNRTVIVTGSARGMGASFARGFVGEGANVVIADILDQEGRTLADELGEHYASTLSSCARMARWGPSAKSALVAKSGAEGYFCVGHADGLGLALKIIDADPAARARNLATVVAIRHAGWISDADLKGALRAFGPRVPIFQSGWPLQRRGPLRDRYWTSARLDLLESSWLGAAAGAYCQVASLHLILSTYDLTDRTERIHDLRSSLVAHKVGQGFERAAAIRLLRQANHVRLRRLQTRH